MSVAALLATWRTEAAVLRRRGAPAQADAMEACAAELEAALAAERAEELSIAEAHRESGYSVSQLRRLFPGRARIRRDELPRKGARAARGGMKLVAAVAGSGLRNGAR